MIALVLAMLWSRRGQAVTVGLLTLLGVAAAVAAPAWLRATDRAVAAGQVAVAPVAERSFKLSHDLSDQRALGDGPRSQSLDDIREALLGLPGFAYVSASETIAIGIEPDRERRTQFVHRQNVCDHLTMVSGRCLSGEGDVVVDERTAQRHGIRPGQSVTMQYAVLVREPGDSFYLADGDPKKLLVSGIYRVPDPEAVYWGTNGYFSNYYGIPDEPVFVLAPTLAALDRGTVRQTVDGVAEPGALAVDKLPAVGSGLASLRSQLEDIGAPITLETGVPDLLARIEAGRTAAHLIVPVPAVALVLLSCLTIFLAVGYGTEGRRPELAVVALRGARWGQRWWLATGENLIAILLGAVAGCIAGQVLVNVVAAARFPGVGADPGLDSLRWAPVAALAALLTALLAEWRQLLSPVAELLRRAPAVPRRAGPIAVQAAVAVLAAIAVVQLFVTGGTLTGLGTFAAALLSLALAQAAARAVLPVVTRYARRALAAGRPGAALAGFQLSRRPGATRIFTLLVAAVAVAGYAACAVDTAARGRAVQAELGTGADRVLSVQAVGRQDLLASVRAAEAGGGWAMAVVRLPAEPGQPAGLAVDAERLAAVANWPAGDAKAAAARLRPGAPEPITFPGAQVSLDLTATGLNPGKLISVGVVVGSPLGDEIVPLGDLREGRHAYARTIDICRQGCRLHAVRIAEGDGNRDLIGSLRVHAPAPRAWRASSGRALRSDGTIDLATLNLTEGPLLVQPVSTPDKLPAVTAGPGADSPLLLPDGRAMAVQPVAELTGLPGAGRPATLVDLDYFDRVSADGGLSGGTQVWLSAAAPADAEARLEAQGLVVTGDLRAARVRAALDQQGSPLALEFAMLIAVLAAALAAGTLVLAATVDRPRRVVELLTWWVTGWALPLAGVAPSALPLPGWPRAWVLALVTLVAFAALAAVAWLTGRRTLRAIR